MDNRKVKPEKFILDATAGYRMMWFNKQHPNALYIDQRPECEPDEIQDFTKLPYPDKTFKLIVFDPPHIKRTSENLNSNMIRDFGYLQPETWQDEIKKGFIELWRCLENNGVLIFKWCNVYFPSNIILKLFPVKPLFYQISASHKRSNSGKKLKRVKTLWFCFMKIPEENKK